MPRFCVVPAYDYLGEVPLHARLLRAHGYAVLVLVNADGAVDYSDYADQVVRCPDVFSEDAVVEALSPYRDHLRRFAGVHDMNWPALLGASVRLGIPFAGLQGQVNSRIKPRMRALLSESLPLKTKVIAAEALTPARLDAAVAALGLPLVVKPIWGQSSNYVEIIRDRGTAHAQLCQIFSVLRADPTLRPFRDATSTWDPRSKLLLEEFIPGREFSFEGFVQRGRFVPLMIQEKYYWAQEGSLRFETGNLCPTPFLDAAATSALHRLVREVLVQLGLDNTFFHVELKWDGQRAHVIEVNPRLGGGSVPAMLDYWFGIKAKEMDIILRMGTALPEAYVGRDGFLLGVFVNAQQPGVFRAFEGIDWVHRQPEFCFETSYCQPGQIIPARAEAPSRRAAWMYCYDAFFWCQRPERMAYLHDETRKRVRLRLEDRP